MFVQVIEGKARDPEAIHRQIDAWARDLMPGAIGYLGSTGGCTSNGDCILIARFESRDAARRNGERPEQTAWWQETERYFDGPVTFHDTEDVELMTHGSLDDAHFVQVMEGHVTDRQRAAELAKEADPALAEARPDLLGSLTVFYGDHECADVAYFTSEEDARRAEQQPITDEFAKGFAEWQDVMRIDRYLDLTEPWMVRG